MILVDTNVWSVSTKTRPALRVKAWLDANQDQLWLSPLVIAEIRYGLERPEAADRRAMLRAWLGGLEDGFRARTLPFDSAAGHLLGRLLLQKPQEAKLLDTLLAAQALSRDCPIATRNVRDFAWTGVTLINPWES